MAYRRYRGSYYSARDIGHERARQHIEDYRRLELALGAAIRYVKQYFFSLPPSKLRVILDAYGQEHGSNARNYAVQKIREWESGAVQMSGQTAARLFNLLPPRMPLATKYQIVEHLWKHAGPKSKKTWRVGLDATVDQVLDVVRKHFDDVVTNYRVPDDLERQFAWLAANDARVKQDLLSHLQQYEKQLIAEGTRLQLPTMIEHLRSEAGQHTHRLAQVLKIGNHELELVLDKNASGVAVVEPRAALRIESGQGFGVKWWWWAIAAAVVLYFFAGPQTSKPSYQPSTYTPYKPSTQPTYRPPQPTYQPSTQPASQPSTLLPPNVAPSTKEADSFSDHGPGRVACDGQWAALHRDAAGYRDFILNCMKNRQ